MTAPDIQEYQTINDGVCYVVFPDIEEMFQKYDFALPEFEDLIFYYTNYDTPYGILASKAEHGK